MKEINLRSYFRGINARRGNVSVISPSSASASPVVSIIASAAGAFQFNAFQGDAFQV